MNVKQKNLKTPFVHLHVHTGYSMLDGACRIKDLVSTAQSMEMPAVAITDHDVMYGAVPFYEAARAVGIKPIIGCEMGITSGSRYAPNSGTSELLSANHLILLASNETGYRNLSRLVSEANLEGFCRKPLIDHEILAKHSQGLIGLSACLKGEIPERLLKGDEAGALEVAARYSDILGKDNFFLEIQYHLLSEQLKVIKGMVALARKTGLGLVATNNVHYLKFEHAEAHELLLCLQSQTNLGHSNRLKCPSSEFYFKSGDEMARIFREIPESITNTLRIADRCNFDVEFNGFHFPMFHVPPEFSLKEYLLKLCREGMIRRYGLLDMANPKNDREKELVARCEYEISVIELTGFITYYLVVRDFIHYARTRNIPVAAGHGAGAGSLVAYLLEITGIDPIRYDLMFELFLNPARVSPPAFNFDICRDRRGEVIEYIKGKYGHDHFARIITFFFRNAKTAIRDVGRGMELPFAECERLAGMIPVGADINLAKALAESPDLEEAYDKEVNCKRVLDYGFVLEGLLSDSGTYEGGMVIAEKPLSEIVPLALNKDNQVITQYPVEHLGKIGLLKIDVLGIKSLTVIKKAVDAVYSMRGISLDIESIPMDDPLTFELFQMGDTVGVSQFESNGMRNYLRKFRPTGIEELAVLNALYRPNRMELIDGIIARKHGSEPIEYEHPLLEPILKGTCGYLIFPEQGLRIANVLAGFPLTMGDNLWRALGKNKPDEMARMKTRFVEGCATVNRISETRAEKILALITKTAIYGVSKARCTAYGVIAFQMAYLKSHYPEEFMSALLSVEKKT